MSDPHFFGESSRLLVVEDDAMTLELMERRLVKAGFTVDVAPGVDEARQLLVAEPELVLLDVMLSGSSGLDLLAEIREQRSLADLPVIMVTALADGDQVAEAFELGANDYVTKPIDFRVLEARVRTQLAFKQAVELRRDEAVTRRLHERTIRAREEERMRLSRELHDDTAQRLASLLLSLDAVRQQTSGEVAEHLATLVEQTEDTLCEVRRLAQGLRPALLEDLGLIAAIERLAEQAGAPEASVQLVGPLDSLPWPHAIALFRLIQEALNNARNHAEANQVSVVVRWSGGRVRAVIEDDGKGFSFASFAETSLSSGGLGLVGMRERARALGGDLEIETAPGMGTAIYVELVVDEEVT